MKTYRILGVLGMISSLVILPYMLKSNVDSTPPTLVTSALGLIFQLGCLCSALGLFQMRAAGNGSISYGSFCCGNKAAPFFAPRGRLES